MPRVKNSAPLPPLPPPPPKTQLFLEAVTQLELKKAAALAPAAYGTWWMNLVREDPWHVVVETLLLIFVVYLLFLKKPKKSRSELTKAGEFTTGRRGND